MSISNIILLLIILIRRLVKNKIKFHLFPYSKVNKDGNINNKTAIDKNFSTLNFIKSNEIKRTIGRTNIPNLRGVVRSKKKIIYPLIILPIFELLKNEDSVPSILYFGLYE